MANLKSLIRLHSHELDEKRRVLGGHLDALAQIQDARAQLERQYNAEKEAVDKTGDVSFTFGDYVRLYQDRQKEFAGAIIEAEKRIEAAKDDLLESYGELKKFEMTQKERDRLDAEERRLRESRNFDEISLEIFRRRDED